MLAAEGRTCDGTGGFIYTAENQRPGSRRPESGNAISRPNHEPVRPHEKGNAGLYRSPAAVASLKVGTPKPQPPPPLPFLVSLFFLSLSLSLFFSATRL